MVCAIGSMRIAFRPSSSANDLIRVSIVYFVAETKGSTSSLQLREIESGKIHCAKEHFKAISGDKVKYDVVDSYQSLLNIVTK